MVYVTDILLFTIMIRYEIVIFLVINKHCSDWMIRYVGYNGWNPMNIFVGIRSPLY